MIVRRLALLALVLLLSPCAPARHKKIQRETLADYVQRNQIPSLDLRSASPGSLWTDAGRLAYLSTDYKAAHVGDLVTILVVQDVKASNSGNVASDRSFSASSGVDALAGRIRTGGVEKLFSPHSSATLAGKAQATSDSSLRTSLAGRIAAVLANGVMVVEAEREVTMNNERQIILVRGMVRPGDVSPITPSCPTPSAISNWNSKAKASSATAPVRPTCSRAGCCGWWDSRGTPVMRRIAIALMLLLSLACCAWAVEEPARKALVGDIATVEGVRDNPLIGYGMVVGLNGTGDRRQTVFTMQTLASVLQRMGVQIPAGTARVNNVAAVFITANLPPFARPGTRLDVTVSSIGDAKSLEGGLLLLSPLYGADGQVYGAAQGPLTVGGYSAGGAGNTKQVNHPTVGRIPGGGLVERDAAVDLRRLPRLSLLLSDPNFSTAEDMAAAINREFGHAIASAEDSRRVEIDAASAGASSLPALLARVESLPIEVHRRAKVVVNERTGTVVMGKDVRLGAVSILHGNFSIEIATEFGVSQPEAFSRGQTEVVAQPSVRTEDKPARRIELNEGASVEQLVNGLQTIGATARDVIAVLQALKAAGALEADLEVI